MLGCCSGSAAGSPITPNAWNVVAWWSVRIAQDGRGAFIAITPQGRAAIEEAAPGHVMAVRRLMFEVLSDEEKAALAAVIDKLLARTGHAPTE